MSLERAPPGAHTLNDVPNCSSFPFFFLWQITKKKGKIAQWEEPAAGLLGEERVWIWR